MRTIALRMKEQYAPICGTVAAHQKLIDKYSYVWYGKLGPAISDGVAKQIMQNTDPRILLYSDENQECYWAHVLWITRQTPPEELIPVYYRNETDQIGTWFQVDFFEKARKDVLEKFRVSSSGRTLRQALQQSTSPYFIIES